MYSKPLLGTVVLVVAWLGASPAAAADHPPVEHPTCDDRIAIANPARHPFKTIATIRYDKDCVGAYKAWGTGALVGPHMLLTAGHVVYNREKGKKNETCNYIQPAAYLDEASGDIVHPYGERVISDTKYKKTNNKFADSTFTPKGDVDYGAIWIVCPFEEISTYIPMVFDYESSFINMSGYPSEDLPDPSRLGEQWRDADQVTSLESRQMVYDVRSTGGASGAPVWEYDSLDRRLLAVNRAHSTECNGKGTRLVWNNEQLINDWLDWEPSAAEKLEAGCAGFAAAKKDWYDLRLYFADRPELIRSAEVLGLVAPPSAKPAKPAHRVYQVIENVKYVWEEYLTDTPAEPAARFIRMRQPVEKWLTLREARILLSASIELQKGKPSGRYETRGKVGGKMPIPMPREPADQQEPTAPDTTRDLDADQAHDPSRG